ncbi:MAG: hypothetical protein J6B56_01035 [Clostridia bacterium]|nr:hypothetical protein [Clostridia bacterium]
MKVNAKSLIPIIATLAIAGFSLWQIVETIVAGVNGVKALEGYFALHGKRRFLMLPVYFLLLFSACVKGIAFLKKQEMKSETATVAQIVSLLLLMIGVVGWAFTDENLCKQFAYAGLASFSVCYFLPCSSLLKKVFHVPAPAFVSWITLGATIVFSAFALIFAFNAFNAVSLVSNEVMIFAYTTSTFDTLACAVSCVLACGSCAATLVLSPKEN